MNIFELPSCPFRFPFNVIGTLLHCNVALIRLDEFLPHRDKLHLIDLYQRNDIGELAADTQVVIKANGSFFSGGLTNIAEFAKILSNAQNAHTAQTQNEKELNPNAQNARANSFDTAMFQLYLGVYKTPGILNKLCFTLTNFFGDNLNATAANCENQNLHTNWSQSIDMREHFFSDVYKVAIQAIERGWFHWDIRRANVLYYTRDETIHFRIIDWEAGYGLMTEVGNSEALGFLEETPLQTPSLLLTLKFETDGWRVYFAVALMELFIQDFLFKYECCTSSLLP